MKASKSKFFLITLAGVFAVRAAETRLPIIARIEVQYSMVSHHCNIGDRVDFYNNSGSPQGNIYYAVPHLVYEPIVTLYNPYNTNLVLPNSRVLLANPPVGFKFKKNDEYLRAEWNNGGPFLGLGRFQTASESNPDVEKTMTLLLSSETGSQRPGGSIVLQPGESRRFMVWVEKAWTWALETGALSVSRSFFDFDLARNLTNTDGRTNNLFGAETVGAFYPGWGDFRAGFQTDGLSVASGRPAATRYPFETGTYGTTSWVAMKLTDSVLVQAKGVDTVLNPAIPDFELSLLAGTIQNPAADTRKSYSFSIGDLVQDQPVNPDSPSISRLFKISDLLQAPNNTTAGGKAPFASFVLVAKSTALQQRKFQAAIQPPSGELYEARLEERLQFIPDVSPDNGPSDYPRSGVVVTGVERVGNSLMLDIAAEPLRNQRSMWKIMGGSDPGAAFADDLTGRSIIREGPEGTGVYKLTIPVPADSGKYFVQIGL
ncbi:MAG: hypothetical protein ABIT37_10695 [Luteolibacter sp.]